MISIGLLIAAALIGGVVLYKAFSPPAKRELVVHFRDVQQSQAIAVDDFSKLEFSTTDGTRRKISEISDAKFTVLVITRGWNQSLCLYCIAQTAQWTGQQEKLQALDAQLLLIFPIAAADDVDKLEMLRQRVMEEGSKIDFPTMLDIDLKSVDQLGIRAQLSKPATYIIDQQGKVRFAYVGQSIADRPSVESILNQLQHLKSQSQVAIR
jgi:peroxiredoxin